jgi:hypothetical protein
MTFHQEPERGDLSAQPSPHVAKDVVQVPDHERAHKEGHTPDDQVRNGLLGRMLGARWQAVLDEVGDPCDRKELESSESALVINRVGG